MCQPPLITSESLGHDGGSAATCAGAPVRSAGAQLGRTRARIGGDFLLARRHRPFGQHLKARRRLLHFRQMPRAAAGLAARIEEVLDDAVFQRMERHHRETSARLEHALGSVERELQFVELFVDEDAQALKRPRRRMDVAGLARAPHAPRCRRARAWSRSAPLSARRRWRARRRASGAPRRRYR